MCAIHVCAIHVCAIHVCAINVCAINVCAINACAIHVCAIHVCAINVCAINVCAINVCNPCVCNPCVCNQCVCNQRVCNPGQLESNPRQLDRVSHLSSQRCGGISVLSHGLLPIRTLLCVALIKSFVHLACVAQVAIPWQWRPAGAKCNGLGP